jgi:drug/metabolite transporter (DMT)-like permease
LVSIFIAGVQGVLISLLPLRYLPGRDIFKWNRAVWALLLGIAAFIFFHLLLGQGSSYVGTINGTIAAAIFTGLFVGATIFAWVFFAIRDRRREANAANDPDREAKEDEDRVSFSLSSGGGSQSDGE